MKKFLVFLLLCSSFSSKAQSFDTLSVMTYNLLLYGANFSNCDNTSNPIAPKDGYLQTVVDYAEPDLLLVQEIGSAEIYSERVLVNVLNTNGKSYYKRADVKNPVNSSIVNQLFYDSRKIGLSDHRAISKHINGNDLVRVIDVYRLFYKDQYLDAESDTVFFYAIGCHFKAGSSSSDENEREATAEAIMEYISDLDPGYFLLAGDLNMKGSNEGAYQNLLSNSYGEFRFYDPINSAGSWNNNSNFAGIHTQSTRSSNTNGGCFSGGGMDDRFDLILTSGQVLEDTGDVSYIQDSYRAVGQDGNHFNSAINSGTNNSVPSAVLSALFDMSDHLPVMCDIKVKSLQAPDSIPDAVNELKENPLSIRQFGDEIRVSGARGNLNYRIINLQGVEVNHAQNISSNAPIRLDDLPSGFYLFQAENSGWTKTRKIVISR